MLSEILAIPSLAPDFIYVNDPNSPRNTVKSLKKQLKDAKICHAVADSVVCFTPRLLYDTLLRGFNSFLEEPGELVLKKYDANFDAFMDGIKHIVNLAGKERDLGRLFVVLDRAERLKDRYPELIVPLTRLSELSRLDISVIFISTARWDDIQPPLGAAPDPFYVDIPIPTKNEVVSLLAAAFPSREADSPAHAYHPSLQPLYAHFVATVCDVCYPFTHDPDELMYIAAARWPGFVKPVLDSHKSYIEALRQEHEENTDAEDMEVDVDIPLAPPSEEVRLRLIRYFMPSISSALEQLYPRQTNALDWASANEPENDILEYAHGEVPPLVVSQPASSSDDGMESLPRISKYILVASYLASMNPAKSDLRMFGRGLDEKKRKRRRNVSPSKRKVGAATIVKLPPMYAGPSPFPVDRMIAILGALYEENEDDDAKQVLGGIEDEERYTIPGEFTDMEISRVGVSGLVTHLANLRLLHRTSAPDRLDGPPMFKSGISYDVALGIAKDLGIPLNDLLWDPV